MKYFNHFIGYSLHMDIGTTMGCTLFKDTSVQIGIEPKYLKLLWP